MNMWYKSRFLGHSLHHAGLLWVYFGHFLQRRAVRMVPASFLAGRWRKNPRFNTFCINQACDSRNANYLHCNLPLWFLSSFQIPVGVIGVTECSQGRGHVTARWLALACVSGNSWDYENTCSVSPSKSFSTCVRYIICCWLWASCHLPPIKTPLCNSAPFSQRTRSWQNTVQHTPLTAFTHFHPSWGLSVGSADTGSAVGRTTPRFQASVEVRLWAAVFSRTWKFFHSYRAKKNKKMKGLQIQFIWCHKTNSILVF